MSKFPSLPGKGPKKVSIKIEKPTPEAGAAQAEGAMALQKFLSKAPPKMPKATPTPTPPGGYKPGLGGVQYEGEKGIDPTQMRPKLATKDKILNPVKNALGMSHLTKGPKMVPKSPPKK